MNEIALVLVFIGNVTLTSYRSEKAQTDSSPYSTSIGERVTIRGCAVSQDLLQSGKIKYGDLLYIEGFGYRFCNDTMNVRMKNSVDLWVQNLAQEKQIGVRHVRIWVVKRPQI